MIAINPLLWLKQRRNASAASAPLHHDALADVVREIIVTKRLAILDDLPAPDRDAVAVRLATQVDDPRTLLRFLWQRATVSPEYWLTLVRCLKVVENSGALWVIRAVTALAEGRAGDPAADPVRQTLLDCLPLLDAALDQVVQRKRSPIRVLRRLFRALTPELAAPRLMRLAFDAATPDPLAWAAADWLAERSPDRAARADPPANPAARSRWIYVDGLKDAAGIQTLGAAALASFFAAGAARRERLGRALLTNTGLSPEIRLAAIDLLMQQESPPWTLIASACTDENQIVRRGALARIGSSSAREAIATLVRLTLRSDIPVDVRLMAVMRLSAETRWDVAPVLHRCALDTSLPLAGRLRAAAALGRRSASLPRLLALIRDPQICVDVRAAAARAAAFPAAIPYLMRLMLDPSLPPLVMTALIEALATPACRAAAQSARSALIRLLAAARADVSLTLALIRVLGALGGDEAVSALAPLAATEAMTRLKSAVPPDILDLPVETGLERALLPDPMMTRLLRALVTAPTVAEQPTTLAQFLAHEADLVRCAAIESLTRCGGARAREAILVAVRSAASPAVAAALAEAINALGSLGDMLNVVVDPALDPSVRWHVADRLALRADGPAAMREAWLRSDLDAFGRELIIEALGRHDAGASASFLARLAGDSALSPVLRERALAALEGVADASLEGPLLHLVNDGHLAPELRGRAAASLPAALSPAARSALRDLLRTDLPPAPLVVGILRALGRAQDAAALPLLLRYSLDADSQVAQAAIEALAASGDAAISPALVRVALSPQADAAVKLIAIEALLRLGEPDAVRLLRPYLRHRSVLVQMRAFRLLADAGQVQSEAEQLVRHRSHPAPLRLCALDCIPRDASAGALLAALLSDPGEDPAVRAAAAARLDRRDHVTTLTEVALDTTAPLIVRTACIAGLGASDEIDALLALSALADRVHDPAACERARIELWSLVMQSLNDGIFVSPDSVIAER
ncbi:MAG: HEAT repeat domain-containing protein [Roseiflexaceae bacterium]|nr:HEAT repeat domain-containing protein [Roseiflexus sp.]MDW8212200.1 HEAT repeat domain-containing protein [Roseiflexaceae bacterium]